MHEASLIEGLLNLVYSSLADYNANNPEKKALRVNEIICEYGILSCFEEQTLRACFEIFTEGTPVEHAILSLTPAPLKCTCEDCGKIFQLLKRHFLCPYCSSDNITFKGGYGLVLQAINVDSEEDRNE